MDETPKTDHAVGPATPAPIPDATEESFRRLKPLAQGIIELVAFEKMPMGNNSNEEDDRFFPVAEKVLALMRDADMKYSERENLFALLLQPFDKVRTIVLDSLNRSFNKAFDIKMGKAFLEVTLPDLDTILKSQVVPETPAEPVDK